MSRSTEVNSEGGEFRSAKGAVRHERSDRPGLQTRHHECLVLSGRRSRRDQMADATTTAGWDTTVCADPQNALVAARRYRFRFAWVDLDPLESIPSQYRELCQLLAQMPDLLLVICGHDGDVEEEIWARQLGVWLYVPGLSNASSEELARLCQQAYETADAARR